MAPDELMLHRSGEGRTPSNFADVRAFHEKFELGKDRLPRPGFVSPELTEFRTKFMQEELDEFKEAVLQDDLPQAFDALLDLVYVALGTADLMCLPWQSGWDEVQRANMNKVRARRAQDSLRGSTFDVVKPKGWTPPQIDKVLEIFNNGITQKLQASEEIPQLDKPRRDGLNDGERSSSR